MKKNTKSNKVKVGIVGEHPQNDAEALQILLNSVAETNVEFSVKMEKFRGGQLDGDKFFRSLTVEADFLDWIILVRDLDGLLTESKKLIVKDLWFQRANKSADKKGIFFLVIYEMEALILADINAFNDFYGLKTNSVSEPKFKTEPKEILEKLTEKTQKGKYKEEHALDIFKKLKFKTVYKNHKGDRSFQTFADELKSKKIIAFEP
jgi:hypothetical protein